MFWPMFSVMLCLVCLVGLHFLSSTARNAKECDKQP